MENELDKLQQLADEAGDLGPVSHVILQRAAGVLGDMAAETELAKGELENVIGALRYLKRLIDNLTEEIVVVRGD